MKLTSLLVLAGLPAGCAFVAPAKVFHGAGVGAAHGSSTAERSSATCQMMARVPFIAGNWKMNPLDLGTAKDLAKAVSRASVCVIVGVWRPLQRRERGGGPLLSHAHVGGTLRWAVGFVHSTCAARQMPTCCCGGR